MQFIGRHGLTCFQNHAGLYLILAAIVIGRHRHHRHVGDGRVLGDRTFDLERGEILATPA